MTASGPSAASVLLRSGAWMLAFAVDGGGVHLGAAEVDPGDEVFGRHMARHAIKKTMSVDEALR